MTSRDFCYWLQGFFELGGPNVIAKDEVETIQKHLALVFIHEIDPSAPPEKQAALNAAHGKPQIGGVGPDGQVYRC